MMQNLTNICNSQAQHPMILTTTGVYMIFPHIDQSAFSSASPVDMLCPIYTFSAPLNLKQTQLIFNMLMGDPKKRHPTFYVKFSTLPEQFEQIIHYIPGSYSNGSWKQLNGFFGIYVNEDTMELLSIPPPI
jgi:hypothetical protein